MPKKAPVGWPDLCGLQVVFRVVILAQIFACVAVLVSEPFTQMWEQLALTGWFVLWLALGGNAWLCALQQLPWSWSAVVFGVVGYLGLLLFALLFTWAVYLGLDYAGLAAATMPYGLFDTVLRNVLVMGLVGGVVLHYLYLEQAWRRQIEAEAQARFIALRARIRPHFLFNSLNTIASLLRVDPIRAETVIEDLADLFRAALTDAPTRTLGDEFALARRYLAIEALRLGDRLRVEWAVETLPLEARVPTLSLQPLVENAVYHGIQPRAEGGVLRISGERTATGLRLHLQNPLAVEATPSQRVGHGLGLSVTCERWQGYFGAHGHCEIVQTAGEFHLCLEFPEWREERDENRFGG